jgi:prepilin-type N-terminal cleavage/methylation domain-containing protein
MRNEDGFTFSELLVVLAIVAMIALGAGVTNAHMFRVSHQNNDWTRTLLQDQSVGYWVSRDVLMAQQITADDPATPDTEFATMNWKDFQSGNSYYVHYALLDSGSSLYKIERRYQVRDSLDGVLNSRNTIVAEGISQCYLTPDEANRWRLTVESQSGPRSMLVENGLYPRLNFNFQ